VNSSGESTGNAGRGLRLSIILVVYNMQREAPRSIASLAAPYQQGIDPADYEILVIENGSSRPLDARQVERTAPNVSYHYIEDAPPSPAHAINLGAERARGEVLAIMIDGAHMLTPRTLFFGLAPFAYRANPIVSHATVLPRPGAQPQTVQEGYDAATEDALLASINWPRDGYELFNIGVPYRYRFANGPPKLYWFVRRFESNCLFARKSAFEAVGGCDLRFDIPGGGALLPDLCRELGELPDATLVQLMGEASFHQVHGGVSTSVTEEEQQRLWATYTAQYEQIRGRPYKVCQKPLEYIGHIPNKAAQDLMFTG
jgi:hypothetical protein